MPYHNFLSKSAAKEFETPPEFNSSARKQFFKFPQEIMGMAHKMRNETNQICFLVAYGYFKATRRFYSNQFRSKDVAFVSKLCKVGKQLVNVKNYDRRQFSRHKKVILQHFGYSAFDTDESIKQLVITKTKLFARSQLRPKLIFLNIINALTQAKIEIPTYNNLSELIRQRLDEHNNGITSNLKEALTDDEKKMLDNLFKKDESKKNNAKRITVLKKFSQSIRPSKIKRNVGYFLQLKSMHELIEPILEKLDLNNEGIRYYATSVLKSQIFQISRRNDTDKYLHAMAFIAHQYYRLHDLLVDVLLMTCQSAINSAEKEHAKIYYQNKDKQESDLSEFLNQSEQHSGIIDKIAAIVDSPELNATKKVREIKKCIKNEEFNRSKYKSDLYEIRNKNHESRKNEGCFDVLESRSKKLQNRVSEIVKHIEFKSDDNHNSTMRGIEFFKEKDGSITSKAPLKFLESNEEKVIYKTGKIRTSLYKIFLFIHIAEEIKAGRINIKNCYRYKSLNDYLISKKKWAANRTNYLKQASLTDFEDINLTLSTLQQAMDKQYQTTNDKIVAGENPHFKAKEDGSYVIKTPKVDKPELDVSLSDLFPEDDSIPLTEVLSSVQSATGFLSELRHWQNKGHKKQPHDRVFYAGLVGYGCQHGPNRIYKIARGINGSELENTVNWYFTLDNINNSTDVLLKFMDKMALPNVYRKNKDEIHTSSDGQKYEVLPDSLNANYSFKYLGKEKGVSVYTFIDERHITFYSTVISSSEREAHYAIDGLMFNDVVKSDIHSTDTHGYTDCIFASMYLLGVTFAPRIKNLKKSLLYSFKSKSFYKNKDYTLLPSGTINTKIIKENWDDILRFIATIKLKEATASQLFKRLNSYSEGHKLYDALKEFGKISKSIFILKYIDDVEFRQAIEKQLNKIESSNKFSKALAVGSSKGIPYATKEEQEIGEACKRLLRNALICWNYMYMSHKVVNEPDTDKRKQMITTVKEGSIVTWGQFNFYGEYDFSDNKLRDSVGFNVPKILGLKVS